MTGNKKAIPITVLLLIAAAIFCFFAIERSEDAYKEVNKVKKTINYDFMKAMWLSQYDMKSIYTYKGEQRPRDEFDAYVERIMNDISELGINTVIVQVRPFGDSMYPSEYYPMSSFVTGGYGKSESYDPFAVIIEKAHERRLSVHAWINPMRLMSEEEIKEVPVGYAVRDWYEDAETRGKYIVLVDERWYLDPAYKAVRELIADGAAEIAERYDVDGIHMDDYFYPTTDESFDAEAYAEYRISGGELELSEFRRRNVNLMVREIYSSVKSVSEELPFGISPAGVMKNNREKLYADVDTWCSERGYIDYICPQVYFGFEHETCAFDKVCREFSDMVRAEGIRLIVGMSLGKAVSGYDKYAGKGAFEWRDRKDVLVRELEYALSMEKCSGVCYFCYQYFFDPLTGEEIPETLEERAKLIPLLMDARAEG